MATYKLTPEQADALLNKLATDDAFRDLFQNDIGAAFKQLPGQPSPPPDLTPGCCLQPRQLASKEKLSQARDELYKSLTSLVEYKPHFIET